jgi:hypothetical protein
MRTIKTYFKEAPFYIASAYRHVGFARFPLTENPVYQALFADGITAVVTLRHRESCCDFGQ